MRSIKQWYFDLVAAQLTELASIQPQVIPEWGHRPQGGGYVADIYYPQPGDSVPQRCWGARDGYLVGDWDELDTLSVRLTRKSLQNLSISIDQKRYAGFNPVKGWFALRLARRLGEQREAEYEAEMNRRTEYYEDIFVPTDTIRLVNVIVSQFCKYGPEPFHLRDLVTALKDSRWSQDRSYDLVEKKFSFLLSELVLQEVVEQQDDVYTPLPKILGVHASHLKEEQRWNEQREAAQKGLQTQNYAFYASVAAAIAAGVSAIGTVIGG